MMTALRKTNRMKLRRIASVKRGAYSEAMSPAGRSVLLHTRVIAVIVLTLTTLACAAGFAHANMVTASGQDCFGLGCEQQMSRARPDQATAPPSTQLAAPLATVASAASEVLPPQNRRVPVVPTLAPSSLRAVRPLAPRSPPAA